MIVTISAACKANTYQLYYMDICFEDILMILKYSMQSKDYCLSDTEHALIILVHNGYLQIYVL